MTVEVQTCFSDLVVPLLLPLLGFGARHLPVDGFLHLCYLLQVLSCCNRLVELP